MKILALTSIRSDYDLLSPLYQKLHQDPDVDLQLLVYGAHLSKTYGYSVSQIHADGFNILLTIETLIDADTPQSRLKTASLFLQSAVDVVAQYQPDLIMYVGDREDVIMGSLLGAYLEIPTVHFWGGDQTLDGCVDNPIRHATSKLTSVHMVSHPEHAKRLQALGEPPQRIFYTGSIALDKFHGPAPMSRAALQAAFNLPTDFAPHALVIYHPLMTERQQYAENFETLLNTLEANHLRAFVSAPNTDPGNKAAQAMLERYASRPNFCYFKNASRDVFLSIYQHAQLIIGNSSSGILESASIPIPAINVGEREKGRLCNDNVIFCDTDAASIDAAIKRVLSAEYQSHMSTVINAYGDGQCAERAYQLIKRLHWQTYLLKQEDPLNAEMSCSIKSDTDCSADVVS